MHEVIMTSQDFLLKINKSCLIKSVSSETLLSSIQEQKWTELQVVEGISKIWIGKSQIQFDYSDKFWKYKQ